MYAIESASYLWANGVWDRVMSDALKFKTKTEQTAHRLRTGIHEESSQIWQTLPLDRKD